MNLLQRLKAIRSEFELGETPPSIVATLNAHVDYLIAQNVTGNVVAAGTRAPQEAVVFQSERDQVSLRELMGERFLVLSWFRGNW